ncbi:hypothetical protein K2Q00_03075 [Patescibacteria group bacterium]|nr:hypothetical protein [Patescibacteria group bacterium]
MIESAVARLHTTEYKGPNPHSIAVRQGRQDPSLTLNPTFSDSAMGHIWKRVWGCKA